MKAKVIKAFEGVPDGQVHPVTNAVGAEIVGDLAAVAVANGWAKKLTSAAIDDAARSTGAAGDIAGYTVAELKALAEKEGVDLAAGAKKADIVAAILAARAAADETSA